MAQETGGTSGAQSKNAGSTKNVVKVKAARASVKEVRVVDTDLVLILDDGTKVFVRDGAVQSMIDSSFAVEFNDGEVLSGQALLQASGAAEISGVAATGAQSGSGEQQVLTLPAPGFSDKPVPAAPAPAPEKSGGGGGITKWLAIGTPLVGGVVAGVLGGGGSAAAPTTSGGTGGGTKPSTPVINVVAGNDQVNAAEKAANVAVSGTAEPNAAVTLVWGKTTKSVTADSNGAWSTSFTAAELPEDAPGTTISATVKSSAGVVSDPGTRTVGIDTTGPNAPIIAKVTGDDIVSPLERLAGVDVQGTAEPNSTVKVSWGSAPTKTVQVDAAGNWKASYSAAEVPQPGSSNISATATDSVGNEGSTATRAVTVSQSISITGRITAGPLIAGHGLTVDLYRGDGTLLVSGVKVNADGSFTANNLAVGAGEIVVARVNDGSGGADYLDEATGLTKDMNAQLLAAKVVEGTSITININPLTTMAALKAGLSADGTGTISDAAAVTKANAGIASAFGLSGVDILATNPVATNSGNFDASDGTSDGEKIGIVLAALSGVDLANEGNSQATITAFSQLIETTNNGGALSTAAAVQLMQGAVKAASQSGGNLPKAISDLLAAPETSSLTINVIAGDNAISGSEAANLVLSGTVSNGATAVVLHLGARNVSAQISGTGWTYTLTADDIAALGADGAKIISADASFPAGATVNATRLVTLKITPPATPVISDVSNDNRVNAAEKSQGVTVQGTGEAGSLVTLSWEGGSKTARVGQNGKWSADLETADLSVEGNLTLRATAEDAFGNKSAAATRQIAIDTKAPDAPVISPIGGDNKIGPSERFEIRGTAEAGAKIAVYLNNELLNDGANTTADASGAWVYTVSSTRMPADGSYEITAKQTDAAGNVGPVSAVTNLLVDAQPPAKPVILKITGNDLYVNAAERNAGVSISGTTEIGTSVNVTWGGQTVAAIVDPLGNWSARFATAKVPLSGSPTITATATDASGNISSTAEFEGVVIDLSTPTPNAGLVAGDDVINIVERQEGITVRGNAQSSEIGAAVTVTLTGANGYKLVRTATVTNQDGSWELSIGRDLLPAVSMDVEMAISAKDLAGNVAEAKVRTLRFDLAAPGPLTLKLQSDTGVNGDNVTGDGTLLVGGVENGATWEYSVNNSEWKTGQGVSLLLDTGTYSAGAIRVRQKDASGNTSNETVYSSDLRVDASKPGAPTMRLANDNGTFGNDNVTNDGTIVFGLLDDDSRLEYFDGLDWVNLPDKTLVLSKGSYAAGEVRVRQVDTAGNIGPESTNSKKWVIDQDAPGGLAPRLVNDTGISSQDGETNDGTISVGTLEEGATFEYSTNKGASWRQVGAGNSFVVPQGEYLKGNIQVRQIDIAGNKGPIVTYDKDLRVITSITTLPSFALHEDKGVVGDNFTNNGQIDVTITGTAIGWEYAIKGVKGGDWQSGAGNSFVVDPGTYLPGDIRVRQYDKANNYSDPVSNADFSIVIDQTPPGALTINFNDSATPGDRVTNDGRIFVTRSLGEVGATWKYSLDGGNHWDPGNISDGYFTLAANDYPDGQVRVQQFDRAGNAGPVVLLGPLKVDTSVNAPTVTWPADIGESSTDNLTKNNVINVSGLEPGASWDYVLDGSTNWIKGGSDNQIVLGDGQYDPGKIIIRTTDPAGNEASSTNSFTLRIDTNLAAPQLALNSDTGLLPGTTNVDGYTSDPRVNVTGLEAGGTWRYSTNGGSGWSAWFSSDTQTYFDLPEGSYAGGSILVEQTDLAGNTRISAPLSTADTIIDKTPPAAPTLSFSDLGLVTSDGITSDGRITVASETGRFRYAVDAAHQIWIPVDGTTFTLPAGMLDTSQIWVRSIDNAGNESQTVKLSDFYPQLAKITVDNTPPGSFGVALAEDNGQSNSDGVTTNGKLVITGMEAGATLRYKVGVNGTWQTVQPTNSQSVITEITLPEGEYRRGELYFQQIDLSGNEGASFVLDKYVLISGTPQAPTVTLQSDTGLSATDRLTSDGTIRFSAINSGGNWQYSLNGGASWTTNPSTDSQAVLSLDEGTYDPSQLKFRQVVGGTIFGETTSLGYTLIVDKTQASLDLDASAQGTGAYASISANVWNYISARNATLADANQLASLTLLVSGIRDGADERLTVDGAQALAFGGVAASQPTQGWAANGADVGSKVITFTLNNVAWRAVYVEGTGFVFSAATQGATVTAQDAQALVRALQYNDAASSPTEAARSFSFKATDAAGNNSATAVSTLLFNRTNPAAAEITAQVYDGTGAVRSVTNGPVTLLDNDNNGVMGDRIRVRFSELVETDGLVNAAGSTTNLSKWLLSSGSWGTNPSITAVDTVTINNKTYARVFEIIPGAGATLTTGTTLTLSRADVIGTAGAPYDQAGSNIVFTLLDMVKPDMPTVALGAGVTTGANGATAAEATQPSGLIKVTAEQGSAIEAVFTNAANQSVTVKGTGLGTTQEVPLSLSQSDLTALGQGTITVRVTAMDAAGNRSTAATTSFTLDTLAPKDIKFGVTDTGDTSDGVTRAAIVNVSDLEAGATWAYSIDGGTSSGWIPLDGSGGTGTTSSFTLAEGTYLANKIQVRQIDAAGNVTITKYPAQLTVDFTAPANASFAILDTGSSTGDGITNQTSMSVTGLEAGAKWEYTVNGNATTPTWTTLDGSLGSGTTSSIPLVNGQTYASGAIQVRQTDTAGNSTVTSYTVKTLTIDNTAPLNAILSITDTGSSTGDGITNQTSMSVTGLEAGATWEYTLNGNATTPTWTTLDGSLGSGTTSSIPLINGQTYASGAIQVRQTDAAGNSTVTSYTVKSLTIDTDAPSAPSFALGTGVSGGATATEAKQTSGVVTVQGEAGATITVDFYVGTQLKFTKSVIGLGTGTGNDVAIVLDDTDLAKLSDGTVDVKASATDAAGNVSNVGSTSFTLDRSTSTPTFSLVSDTGTAGDAYTSNGQINVANLEAGSTRFYSINDGGTWTEFTSNSFSLGSDGTTTTIALNQIRVKQVDAAGNEAISLTDLASAYASQTNLVIDKTVATPGFALTTDTGATGDWISSNGSITVSGIEAGATWEYSTNGGQSWTPGSGTIFTLDTNKTYAVGSVRVRQTDRAGNVSTVASNTSPIIIDTTSPTLAMIAMSNDYGTTGDYTTNQNSVVVTGSSVEANPGGTVQLTLSNGATFTDTGTSSTSVALDSAGRWLTPKINLATLAYGASTTLSATATDAAGNTGSTITQAITKSVATAAGFTKPTADLSATMTALNGFRITGPRWDARLGASMAAGDVNKDGVSDFIFGATGGVQTSNIGDAIIVYGKSTWANSTFSTLSMGTNGFIVRGTASEGSFGYSVAYLGDVNGDGIGDYMVGAPDANNGSVYSPGAAFIVYGSTSPLGTLDANGTYVLSTSALTSNLGFIVKGALVSYQKLGYSVAGPGDLNGDGVPDLATGILYYGDGDNTAAGYTGVFNGGGVFLIFGRKDANYGTTVTGRQEFSLSDFNATNGIVLRGMSKDDNAGGSIAGAGDFNGDGIADLLIGATGVDRTVSGTTYSTAGAAYVLFGKPSGSTWSSAITDPNGGTSGRKVLVLGTMNSADGLIINGEGINGSFGFSVNSAGDINGDGYADIVIGAKDWGDAGGAQKGAAYVIFGGPTLPGTVANGIRTINVDALTSAQGFTIRGAAAGDLFGYSVGSAGDVNGDGIADLYVAAPAQDKAGTDNLGFTYIIYGKSDGTGWGQNIGGKSVLNIADMTNGDGQIYIGASNVSTGQTSTISPIRDVNNDGIADSYVPSNVANSSNGGFTGYATMLYGSATAGGLTLTGTAAAETLMGSRNGDTVTGGGGGDYIYTFEGSDLIIVPDANFARIDAGAGDNDTLRIDNATAQTIDLTNSAMTGKLAGIERIDLLAGKGAHTLILDDTVLRALSDTTDRLIVTGDSADSVQIKGLVSRGTRVLNGVTYNVYGTGAGVGELWVQSGMNIVASLVMIAMSNDYGTSGDFKTSQNEVAVAGTLAAGSSATLTITGATFAGGATQASLTRDANGNWISPKINLSALGYNASATLTATITDAQNNVSTVSQTITKEAAPILTPYTATTASTGGVDISTSAALTIFGPNANSRFAASFALGDLTGDGVNDFIFGAVGTVSVSVAGYVYIIKGRSSWQGTSSYDLAATANASEIFALTSSNASDGLGKSVAFLRDINGDSSADFIAGAPNVTNIIGGTSTANSGAAYIVFGSAVALNSTLLTSDLTPSKGFVFLGASPTNNPSGNGTLGEQLGLSVAGLPDFNGDGRPDIAIGAPGYDRPAAGTQTYGADVGGVMVVFGQAQGNSFGTYNATTNRNEMNVDGIKGSNGLLIRGASSSDFLGYSVANAGDVNGDGVSDLIVGAYGRDHTGTSYALAGGAYVIYGKKAGTTWSSAIDDPASPDPANPRKVLDVTNLTPADGFFIKGEYLNGYAGYSVNSAGDVNGDGYADVIVGAPYWDNQVGGTATGYKAYGAAYVIFGGPTGIGSTLQTISTDALPVEKGFIIRGPSLGNTAGLALDQFGFSVGPAGDVNGDGIADLIVSAPGQDRTTGNTNSGYSYIIYGKPTGSVWGQATTVNGVTRDILEVSKMGADSGMIIYGDPTRPATASGYALSYSAPGDINNDGIADAFIPSYTGSVTGKSFLGYGSFLSGSATGGGLTLNGDSKANILLGGLYNDIVSGGGGADTILTFEGNDTITIADANFAKIDGGSGTDTLRLAAGLGLNLTITAAGASGIVDETGMAGIMGAAGLAAGALAGIEIIDLSAPGGNSLTVTEQSLLALSDTSDRLIVNGDSSDYVSARGFTLSGQQSLNGATYNVYGSGPAELWVKQGITVSLTKPAAPAFALVADTGSSNSDGVSNNGQIIVSGLETGGSWSYSVNGGNWTTGDASGKFTLTAGTYAAGSIQVRQTDASGTTSDAASNLSSIVIDATVAQPSVSLAADTGTSSTDGITNNNRINVSGIEAGATWQYSFDGGAVWSPAQASSVTSFTLAASTYAANSILVRQTDIAGNVSQTGTIASAVTIDLTLPGAPTLTLVSDTGVSATDLITSNGLFTVTGLESNATWQYSTDSGTTWTSGTGSSFTLTSNTYANGAIRVRQTDSAGNIGTAYATPAGQVIIDTAAATPTQTTTLTNVTDNLSLNGSVGSTGTPVAMVSGRSTDDFTPTLNGTISAALSSMQVVGIYDGTTRLGNASVTGTTWTFSPYSTATGRVIQGVGLGSHSYTARVESVADLTKQGAASTAFTLTENALSGISINGVSSGVRYLMLQFNASAATYLEFAELKIMVGPAQSQVNIAPSLLTLSSFTQGFQGFLGTRGPNSVLGLIDGVVNYDYASPNGYQKGWLQIDLGREVKFDAITLTSWGGASIDNMTIYGFNSNMASAIPNSASTLDLSAGLTTLGAWKIGTLTGVTTANGVDYSMNWNSTTLPSGSATGNGSPTLSGTLAAALGTGEELAIYDGTTKIGTATITGLNWTFTPSSALALGTHSFKAAIQASGTSTLANATVVTAAYSYNVTSVTPVVMDLNHDGDLSYHWTSFDLDQNGTTDHVAWAAPQDGVLVWDKFGDHQIHEISQFAFTAYGGKTDLEGLALAFDSNHDGVFNNQDLHFDEFAAWQDRNGDGKVDIGEMMSLKDLGITSIGLTSDHVQRTPMEGVQETGRAVATTVSGAPMVIADAAFQYTPGPTPANSLPLTGDFNRLQHSVL